jgi:AcrR family transcriptional regulator
MQDSEFYKVLDTVVRLDVTAGHLRWKISDLSRLSGVQRTLIYYYFGKSKEVILATAINYIGEELYGLSRKRMEMWRRGEFRASLRRTRELFAKAPHAIEFFFHWRYQKSDVQDRLMTLEMRFQRKLKDFFPKLTAVERQALYTVYFGLVLIPDLSEEVQDLILKKMPFPVTGF